MYEENYETQQLQCVDCGQIFEFSAEDQEFYAQKGYSSPKRCPECRKNRKAARNGGGGSRGFRGERREYTVICAACGCETTVPFKPSNDRPVFCSECYKKQKDQ